KSAERVFICRIDHTVVDLAIAWTSLGHMDHLLGKVECDNTGAQVGKSAGSQSVSARDVEKFLAGQRAQKFLNAWPYQRDEEVVPFGHPFIPESGVHVPGLTRANVFT